MSDIEPQVHSPESQDAQDLPTLLQALVAQQALPAYNYQPLPTLLPTLDEHLGGGLTRGRLTLLLTQDERLGSGFSLTVARHMAAQPVLYVSWLHSDYELLWRTLAGNAWLPANRIRELEALPPEDLKRARAGYRAMQHQRLFFRAQGRRLTIQQLLELITREVKERAGGVAAVVLDAAHVLLTLGMTGASPDELKVECLMAGQRLRVLATELNVGLLVVCSQEALAGIAAEQLAIAADVQLVMQNYSAPTEAQAFLGMGREATFEQVRGTTLKTLRCYDRWQGSGKEVTLRWWLNDQIVADPHATMPAYSMGTH